MTTGGISINNQIRIKSLISEKDAILQKLKVLPSEELIAVKDRKHTKWYVKKQGETIYLSKKRHAYASKLAYKKYLEYRFEDITQEIDAINAYDRLCSGANRSEALFMDERYRDLLLPYFCNGFDGGSILDDRFNDLHKVSNNINQYHPEQLIHPTLKGHKVRSKSEGEIANLLFVRNIQYQYEAELNLNGVIIYPDFMISHPKTGKIYYWEHFGIMDDTGYVENYKKKIGLYVDNGIIPTFNLITTYETKEQPLDINYIYDLADFYFS